MLRIQVAALVPYVYSIDEGTRAAASTQPPCHAHPSGTDREGRQHSCCLVCTAPGCLPDRAGKGSLLGVVSETGLPVAMVGLGQVPPGEGV